MAVAQSAQVVPVPIPTAGLNKRDPLIDMAPQYCPWALNWEPEPQFCKVRKGFVIHTTISGVDEIIGLGVYGNEMFAYCDMTSGDAQIFDVTTTTASSDHTAGGTPAGTYPTNFAGRLAFVTSGSFATTSRVYNGSTWAATGFTLSAAAVGGRTTHSHKGRVYMTSAKTIYYSSTVGGVTGATTEWDVSTLFRSPWDITFMNTWSSPGERSSESYLVIGDAAGQVLVYAGDYPDAANWERVGDYQVGKSISYNSSLAFNGDVWFCTETGLISLKSLAQLGSDNIDDVSVSAAINPYWTKLVKEVSEGEVLNFDVDASIAHWPQENKVFVLMNGFLDNSNTVTQDGSASTLLVYNTVSRAWQVQKIASVASTGTRFITYFKDGVYYVTGNVVMRISPTVYKDEDYDDAGTYTEYALELDSAFLNFGSNKRFKSVKSFNPIFKTDFGGGKIGMRASADFGKKTTATSNQALQDGYNNHPYNVGVEGNYLQYQFRGTSDSTSTDGFELYSMGVGVV